MKKHKKNCLKTVRDNSRWKKVKDVIKKHGLPMMVDVIRKVVVALISSATEGAVIALLKNGIYMQRYFPSKSEKGSVLSWSN